MEYITIVGSRSISAQERVKLLILNDAFNSLGFTLRSGGAKGADETVNNFRLVEIFIPWDGYNELHHDGKKIFSLDRLPDQGAAIKKMKEIHPNPSALKQGAQKLHTRNIYQVIGKNGADGQKSCLLVYCADEDIVGNPVGGTRTAVMFAKELGVPTINIRKEELDLQRIVSKMIFTDPKR